MTYPWAGFGALQFQRSEMPLFGTDSLWIPSPKIDRQTPLGAIIDDIQPLGPGSDERQWEAWFTPSRYEALRLVVGTTALLVDWQRPQPGQRMAYFEKFTKADSIGRESVDPFGPAEDLTGELRRMRLFWISQS